MSQLFESAPHCEELVQCIYGLNYLEFQIFCTLMIGEEVDVTFLSEFLNRPDKTKINRALNKLLELGLLTRRKVSGQRSGYRYLYKGRPLEQVQKELKLKVDVWYEGAIKEIERMKIHFDEKVAKMTKVVE